MAKNKLTRIFFSFFFSFILNSYLLSCPLWFWVNRDLRKLNKSLKLARRGQDELVVFSKIASTGVASPYQWDALNPAGGLDFARQGLKISQLKTHDRLVVDPIFGDKVKSFKDFPCKYKGPILEVINYNNSKEALYITLCKKDKKNRVVKTRRQNVFFDKKNLLIKTNYYSYFVRPKNQILFKNISVKHFGKFN